MNQILKRRPTFEEYLVWYAQVTLFVLGVVASGALSTYVMWPWRRFLPWEDGNLSTWLQFAGVFLVGALLGAVLIPTLFLVLGSLLRSVPVFAVGAINLFRSLSPHQGLHKAVDRVVELVGVQANYRELVPSADFPVEVATHNRSLKVTQLFEDPAHRHWVCIVVYLQPFDTNPIYIRMSAQHMDECKEDPFSARAAAPLVFVGEYGPAKGEESWQFPYRFNPCRFTKMIDRGFSNYFKWRPGGKESEERSVA